MKLFKTLLIVLLVLVNVAFAQPAFADKPKFLKNPDYIEVTKNLNELKKAKETQAQTEGSTPEEIQRKIDQLEFQKYALETGITWGKCINETGKTLAVYGPTPDFDDDDDDDDDSYANALYFLANGQATKDKWDCDGVYLPNDARTTVFNADGRSEDVSGPIAIKISDGSQLVVKTNPNTGAVEFNVPPTKVVKAGEGEWFIPNVAQVLIDNRVPNAPGVKIADATNLVAKKNPEPSVAQSVPPRTQSQNEPKLQPQPLPEIKLQPNLPERGYYRK
jgi:hypothetical protein